MPILILGTLSGSTAAPTDPGVTLGTPAVFTAASAQPGQGDVLFVAQSAPDFIFAAVDFAAQSLPLPLSVPAREAVVYSGGPSGLPGPVLSWEYTHNGEAEELSATVLGLFGMATPTVSLSAEARTQSGARLARLPTRTFATIGQEPQEDVGANETTFRFRNAFTRALRGDELPELIPWKGQPTPDNCGGVRQKLSVSGLVARVLQPYGVSLETDPLSDACFEEGRSEFSTLGLTPQAVWDATYGALGMVLESSGGQGASSLVGRFPNPLAARAGAVIPEDWITSLTQGRELLQTPTALTVKGADHFAALDLDQILGWLGDHPAAVEVGRELAQNQEWNDPVESSGTARTQRGYLKSGGQMVSTLEITTDDVEVRETIEDQPFFKLWSGVATGYKRTTTQYDTLCPGRPVLQVTQSKSWAFDAQTQGGTFSTTGPSLYRNLTVGDLAADELTVTTYRYSPQGFLAAQTTHTRKLASLEQEDAELAPAERKPPKAREYVNTTQTEQWQPIGGGRWLYTPGVSGQTLVPVYDKKTGDAIRTASVARSSPDAPRVTDQAPPSYECGACAVKYVQSASGVVLRTGDAGFAEPREVSLGFLPPSELGSVARAILGNDWGRVVTQIAVPLPLGYFAGDWTSYGRVRELRVGQEGGTPVITASLTTVRPDNLLGTPASAPASDLNSDTNSGTAIMLAGTPGGALGRISTGWSAADAQPKSENVFIAFRTGFPPRPGDEISWQMVNGRREAVNAR